MWSIVNTIQELLRNEKKTCRNIKLQVWIRKNPALFRGLTEKKKQEIKYIRFYQREKNSCNRIRVAVRYQLLRLRDLWIYSTFLDNKQKLGGGGGRI
jgi:hypothetical protein